MGVFGADLECVLYAGAVSLDDFCKTVSALEALGTGRHPVWWLQAIHADGSFERVSECDDLTEAPNQLVCTLVSAEDEFEIAVRLHRGFPVIVLSVRESDLVDDSRIRISKDRLESFARLCRVAATELGATRVYLGTEAITQSEMSMKFADDQALPDPPVAFSEFELERLRRWYARDYARRWEG